MKDTLNYIVRDGSRIPRPPSPEGFTARWITRSKPSYTYTPPVWKGPLTRMKLVRSCSHTLHIPRTMEGREVGGVLTYFPVGSPEVTPCFTVTPDGRGNSWKLREQWVDLRWGIHSPTRTGLCRAVRKSRLLRIRHRRVARLRRLSSEQLERRLMNSRKLIIPVEVSLSAGNCREGTYAFLKKVGVDPSRRCRAGALFRLVRRKGLSNNLHFKAAAMLIA